MHTYQRSIVIDAPIEVVFHFHDDPANLLKITPKDVKVELLGATPAGKGQRVSIMVVQFGFFKSRWDVEITEYEPPYRMVDVAHHSPFRKWRQERRFEKLGDRKTKMTDYIEYELPVEALANIFAGKLIEHEVDKMFRFRQARTKALIEESMQARTAIAI
ncbi:MAG: SRPBCC family protein [Chloroherpetonaceae bacterium]|nr:SRPBCC family protein [Chloroherpetonaceae bacterium]MCS7210831.1 SRPBCC family protein [Chloroherpetonaceae bacterium]MDW8020498.1 SRPBCC family protein [Chloroherpetonaceae bacterium]MDW8465370.1 SRPBCC family protein [Chloroherpetonaceae bacterium]